MTSEYIYPCPACDQTFNVEVSQAGRSVRCPFCSESHELPKLSEIRRLQPSQEEKPMDVALTKKMGLAQTWMFVAGLPLLLIGAFVGGYHILKAGEIDGKLAAINRDVGVDEVNQQIQAQSPEQLWNLWHEEILENPPTAWKQSELLYWAQQAQAKRTIAYFAFGFAVVGLGLIGAALVTGRKSTE